MENVLADTTRITTNREQAIESAPRVGARDHPPLRAPPRGGATRAVTDSRGRVVLDTDSGTIFGVVTDSLGTGPLGETTFVDVPGAANGMTSPPRAEVRVTGQRGGTGLGDRPGRPLRHRLPPQRTRGASSCSATFRRACASRPPSVAPARHPARHRACRRRSSSNRASRRWSGAIVMSTLDYMM